MQANIAKIKEIEERIRGVGVPQPAAVVDQLGLELKAEGAYDPSVPNDYDTLVRQRESRLKAEARDRQRQDSERRRLEQQAREKEEERAAYAQQAQGHVPNIGRERESDAGPSQPVALKIMQESGWKQGHGLGAQGQGMAAALAHEKTGKATANIVMQQAPPKLPEAPPKKIKVKGRPTRVILLRNMVGPGEVDQDLQPEIEEECTKYGPVEKVAIHEVQGPGVDPAKAVRIFVKFARQESSMKALVALNGRHFGGKTVEGSFYPMDKFDAGDLAPAPGEG